MKPIDNLLNKITMYRLVVYVLGIYSALAVVYAFLGKLSASPTELVLSLGLILTAAYVTDRGFGRLFGVPTNMESALISSLILFLIVRPADSLSAGLALVLAGGISSASKFLLAWNAKHVFNPAAFAAAVVSLGGLQASSWWVGSSLFWPVTLLLGLAVVRKTRRFSLVVTFVVVSLTVQLLLFTTGHHPLSINLQHALTASPLIFLATIMLIEPATMPPRQNLQVPFAALVALLYATAWHVGWFRVYPEVALLIGNIFAYIVSPKFRVRLTLSEIRRVSDKVYEYVFKPDRALSYLPGQYMEWTLAGVPYDGRGNRRTFTIASSPTEQMVHLGLKYYEPASMYKTTLSTLKPGDVVYGSQIAGNFTLQGNEHKKLAFIAGGVGITPFRSMVKYLTDTNTRVDIVLLYVVGDAQELAYAEEFNAARSIGIRTVPVVTQPGYATPGVLAAKLDPALISSVVPDYTERTFYVSGPNAMVVAAKGYLRTLGVSLRRIKTDHFSGY